MTARDGCHGRMAGPGWSRVNPPSMPYVELGAGGPLFLIMIRTVRKSSPEIRRPRVERAQLDSSGSGLLTRQLVDPTGYRKKKMHQIDSLKHQRRALSFRVRLARARRQAYTATTPVRGDETPGRQLVGYRHLRYHHLRRLPSGLGSSTTLHVPNTVG